MYSGELRNVAQLKAAKWRSTPRKSVELANNDSLMYLRSMIL